MKKTWKTIMGMALAVMMLFASVPVQAAQTNVYVPENVSCTLYSSKDVNINGTKKNKVYVCNIPGKVTELKSSKKSVATVSQKSVNGMNVIYLTLKKAGKTTVSFKYKSRTYKMKVTVEKYKNPIASVKIGNTTLSASKFKSRSTCTLKYSKFANKKQKVTIYLANGWELLSGRVNGKEIKGFFYTQKGWAKSSSLIKNKSTITVKGGKGFTIIIDAINKKTGQMESIEVSFK